MAKTARKLRKELKACKGNAACIKQAEDVFAAAQDTTVQQVQDGGKVFTDADGDIVFVSNGGKVF